jgi:hypothetical protein
VHIWIRGKFDKVMVNHRDFTNVTLWSFYKITVPLGFLQIHRDVKRSFDQNRDTKLMLILRLFKSI